MEEDSNEELEEIDERMQSSSSEDEDNTEETEVMFRTRRAKDSSKVFDFTGPPSGVNRSVAPHYQCRILSTVTLHALLQGNFSTYTRRDESLLPPIHGIQKQSKHFSTIT